MSDPLDDTKRITVRLPLKLYELIASAALEAGTRTDLEIAARLWSSLSADEARKRMERG